MIQVGVLPPQSSACCPSSADHFLNKVVDGPARVVTWGPAFIDVSLLRTEYLQVAGQRKGTSPRQCLQLMLFISCLLPTFCPFSSVVLPFAAFSAICLVALCIPAPRSPRFLSSHYTLNRNFHPAERKPFLFFFYL